MSFAKVHVFKLGDVADYLIDEGLARQCDGPGWELWLEVEERTAGMFMAYLAATLGGLDRVRMDPVTDQTGAMAALAGVDSRIGLTLKRARELRLSVLEALLPGPAAPVDAKALRKFKDEHGDELAAFRDHVDEELLKAAGLQEGRRAGGAGADFGGETPTRAQRNRLAHGAAPLAPTSSSAPSQAWASPQPVWPGLS